MLNAAWTRLVAFSWLAFSSFITVGATRAAEPSRSVLQQLIAPPADGADAIIVKFKDSAAARSSDTLLAKASPGGKTASAKAEATRMTAQLSAASRSALQSAGLKAIAGYPRLAQLVLKSSQPADRAIDALYRSGTVEYAVPNFRRAAQSRYPDDEFFGLQWALEDTGQELTGLGVFGLGDRDIDAPEAWDLRTDASTVVIAVIDSGIDYEHPDLAPNMWVRPGEVAGNAIDDDGNGFVDDVFGIDLVNGDSDPMDDSYHGTLVAGIMGAAGNNQLGIAGVAWKTQLMAVKAMNWDRTISDANAIAAIEYVIRTKEALQLPRVVINMSWGGPQLSPALRDAIATARDAGILVIAAAGNDASDNDSAPFYPASFDLDNIVSVGGSANHQKGLMGLSNFGCGSVDVMAPAYNLATTYPHLELDPPYAYANGVGSSMATAVVSGTAALAWAEHSDGSWADVKSALLRSVQKFPDLRRLSITQGIVRAPAALSSPVGAAALWSAAPVTALPGRTVTIRGYRFGDSAGEAYFHNFDTGGQTPLEIVSWKDAEIAARVPASAAFGPGEITVKTATGVATNGGCFSVGSGPAVVGELSLPRVAPAYAQAGDALWLFGGNTYYGLTSMVERLDMATGRTRSDTRWAMPKPLALSSAAAAYGKIYVIGGVDFDELQASDALQIFDPLLGTWSNGAPLPTPVASAAVASAGRTIYVFGGVRQGAENPAPEEYSARTFIYDTLKNQWTEGAPLPVGLWAASAVWNSETNQIEVIGGYAFNAETGGPLAVSTVWSYDIDRSSWSAGPSLRSPRAELGAFRSGKSTYAIHGAGDFIDSVPSNWATGELLASGAWSTALSGTARLSGMAVGTSRTQGFVAGGAVTIPGFFRPAGSQNIWAFELAPESTAPPPAPPSTPTDPAPQTSSGGGGALGWPVVLALLIAGAIARWRGRLTKQMRKCATEFIATARGCATKRLRRRASGSIATSQSRATKELHRRGTQSRDALSRGKRMGVAASLLLVLLISLTLPALAGTRQGKPLASSSAPAPDTIIVKLKRSSAPTTTLKSASLGTARKQGAWMSTQLSADARSALSTAGAKVIKGNVRLGQLVVKTEQPLAKAIDALIRSGAVEYAVPNYRRKPFARFPNDERFEKLWGLHDIGQTVGYENSPWNGLGDHDINAPEAWDIRTDASSVLVAVIDTGIDYTHPDLAANMWINPGEIPGNEIDDDGNGYVDDIHGIDILNGDSDPMDDVFHGTHVAGTIGAVGNNGIGVTGVAWNVQLMAVKFLNEEGGDDSDAIEAVDYVIRTKERLGLSQVVINASWGGSEHNPALEEAIAAARDAGILFVAAAGNDGRNIDESPNYPSGFDVDNIISVGANAGYYDGRAGFSNFGCSAVDVTAPGVEILSTVPGEWYEYANGTSMAAPAVAGIVALRLAQSPQATWMDLRDALMHGSERRADLARVSASQGHVRADKVLQVQAGLPTLWNVSPAMVRPGSEIKLRGRALGTEKGAVRFHNPDANADFLLEVLSWNDQEISVRVPRNAAYGYGELIVDPAGGSTTNSICFALADRATQAGKLAVPRHMPAYAQLQDKLWVIGGIMQGVGMTALVERYDLGKQYSEMDSKWMLPKLLGAISAAAIDKKIYVGGGMDLQTEGGAIPPDTALQIFDTATQTWTDGTPLPEGLAWTATAAANGKLYVFGGFRQQYPPRFSADISGKTYIYDPASSQWTEGAPLPFPVAYAGAIYDPNRDAIVVLGGEYLDPANDGVITYPTPQASARVQLYDPKKNTWTAGPDMQRARYGMGVLLHNDAIYALHGCCDPQHNGGFALGEMLAGGSWVTAQASPYDILHPAVAKWGSHAFVLGGDSGVGPANNAGLVWTFELADRPAPQQPQPPSDPVPPAPSANSSGGGGALSWAFVTLLLLMLTTRKAAARRSREYSDLRCFHRE